MKSILRMQELTLCGVLVADMGTILHRLIHIRRNFNNLMDLVEDNWFIVFKIANINQQILLV